MRPNYAAVIPVLVCVLFASVLACTDEDPTPVPKGAQVLLDRHRAAWKESGIFGYAYEYIVLCECPDSREEPIRVGVDSGKTKYVAYAESRETPLTIVPLRLHSIEGLFEIIQDAITDDMDHIAVSYDKEKGYPTKIEIDYRSNAIDDEYTLIVTDFEAFRLNME